MSSPTPVWMDCDPGHDDAFALLLAAFSEEIKLLGVSVVHGNDRAEHCAKNACRFLWTCGIKRIPVYVGASRPLVREAKYCPEIHGTPGEDGVSGMCGYHFPDDIIFSNPEYQIKEGNAVIQMAKVIMNHTSGKVTIVATGAHTNLALAIRLFPEIINRIDKIIFMGGAIGLGNTGVAAEFNIEIDPEATRIVLHSGIPLVMLPLELTHSVLVTDAILDQIRHMKMEIQTGKVKSPLEIQETRMHPHVEYENIFQRLDDTFGKSNTTEDTSKNKDSFSSPFSACCFQLLTFFKSTYEKVFSFKSPPLHDPCAVFYVIAPECFQGSEMFVDVELGDGKCVGRTLCDIHGIMKREANVRVCSKLDVNAFWARMLSCIKTADGVSPLNN